MSKIGQKIPNLHLQRGRGGSGGGDVTVKNGDEVIGTFPILRFEGQDVNAVAGMGEAIIQIPPSAYVPNFNTAGAFVGDFATSTRFVAAPTVEGTPYKIGDWSAGSSRPCTNATQIVHTNANLFSISDNTTTTMRVEVFDADGITSLRMHQIVLTGNTDVTLNDIRIQITGFAADNDKYKAKVTSTVNINNILPEGGRFSVRLTHNNGGINYIKNQSHIFYDPNPINPTITNPTFSENVATIVKISGVNFYGAGSTFNTSIGSINNINNRSYPQPFINISGAELGLPQLNLSGNNLTGWTNVYSNTGASYNNSGWAITASNFYNLGSVKVQGRWLDWITNAYQDSLTVSVAISTYVNNATRIFEDFRNETRRLKDDFTTVWNSAESLTVADTGDGLQALNSQLVYPQIDFTTYNPDMGTQPNYAGLSGDKVWKSRFFFTGVNKSNGIFRFSSHNITEGDITSKDVDILISIDKVNWFTLSEDYPGGSLSDGQGCRINPGDYNMGNNQLRFTLGTGKFTDASSEWGIYFKIIYKEAASAKFIDSFEITDWV